MKKNSKNRQASQNVPDSRALKNNMPMHKWKKKSVCAFGKCSQTAYEISHKKINRIKKFLPSTWSAKKCLLGDTYDSHVTHRKQYFFNEWERLIDQRKNKRRAGEIVTCISDK